MKFIIKKVKKFVLKPFVKAFDPKVSMGQITSFGVKILDDGRQYVICCKTNKPILKSNARYIGANKEGHFWISKDKAIYSHNHAWPSIWE